MIISLAIASVIHSTNPDVFVAQEGLLAVRGSAYTFEAKKDSSSTHKVEARDGSYELVLSRDNGRVIRSGELTTLEENVYQIQVRDVSSENDFHITHCRSTKGNLLNDMYCSSVNTEICNQFNELSQNMDAAFIQQVSACKDLDAKIKGFKDRYSRIVSQKEYADKHTANVNHAKSLFNKRVNALSLTDLLIEPSADSKGNLSAAWESVLSATQYCPQVQRGLRANAKNPGVGRK